MRCKLCDASSTGLSSFRSDGRFYAGHFHTYPNGDIVCDECYSYDEEIMEDYYDRDLEEEEQADAFEYD